MLHNTPINSALPAQQVSYKKKFIDDQDKYGNTKWMKDCMDALESLGRYSYYNNIILKKNYDIVQGRFNIEDYIDNFEAYDLSTMVAQEFKLPNFLKHYDITTKAVKLFIGEFLKRPDLIRVVAKDPITSNEKLRIKKDLTSSYLQEKINQEITNKLISQGIDPNRDNFKNQEESSKYKEFIQQKYQELTPESIERYLMYDFRSAGEHWGQATISDDIERFRLREQDMSEFYHMMVVDRAFSHMYLTPSGYGIESWNPLNVFYQYSTQAKNIEDLDYCGRILYMSKTEVINYLGWKMSIDQLEFLYPEDIKGSGHGGSVYKEFFNATMYPFADYREYSNLATTVGQAFGGLTLPNSHLGNSQFNMFPSNLGSSNYVFNQTDLVQVTQAYFKSQRKVGKLILLNPETGKPMVKIVDEFFDPKLFGVKEVKYSFADNMEPNTVSWTWIPETWKGIKVNVNYDRHQNNDERNAIYLDIKPNEFQFRGNDPRLIYNCKLPVCGQIFNNVNGDSQSIVDLLKPYQVLVNAFYNQAYQVAQKNNGKFFIMGASLLPSVKDWGGEESQEKFMSIVTSLGLGIVDDSTANQSASMQYGLKVLDMDESDRVTRLINLAMLVEQQGFMQLGITPQRQGSIQASETATGTNTAVNNSYAITEIYFEQFNNYRRRKLQMLLELAQYVETQTEGDIVKQYTTTDLGRAFLKIASTDVLLRDLGVYFITSGEEVRKKALIEELILKNNQSLMPLSKLIEIIKMENLSDVQKRLEQQEAQQMKSAHEAEERKMAHEKELMEMEASEKQKDREADILIAQLNNQNKLDAVTLQGIANESSYDPNADLTDKLIKQREIQLKESQINSQSLLGQTQMAKDMLDTFNKTKVEREKMAHDKKLKNSEQKSKQTIEKQKLKQIESQNKNQIELANKKAKSDLEIKNKDIELKNLDMEIKLLDLEISKDKSKELNQIGKFKMEETTQKNKHKLKEEAERHKQALKNIKIKPKIKK